MQLTCTKVCENTANTEDYNVNTIKEKDLENFKKFSYNLLYTNNLNIAYIKKLSRCGIPMFYRKSVWYSIATRLTSGLDHSTLINIFDYSNLQINKLNYNLVSKINLDKLRTFETDQYNSFKVNELEKILYCYAIYNTELGYCQGMNFLVSFLLSFYDNIDAFVMFARIMTFRHHYFIDGMVYLRRDLYVVEKLLKKYFPKLQNCDCLLQSFITQWILCLFTLGLPRTITIRLWDSWLLEGEKVTFRFIIGILHSILKHNNINYKAKITGEELVQYIKSSLNCLDVNEIIKECFRIHIKRNRIMNLRKAFYNDNKIHVHTGEIKQDLYRKFNKNNNNN